MISYLWIQQWIFPFKSNGESNSLCPITRLIILFYSFGSVRFGSVPFRSIPFRAFLKIMTLKAHLHKPDFLLRPLSTAPCWKFFSNSSNIWSLDKKWNAENCSAVKALLVKNCHEFNGYHFLIIKAIFSKREACTNVIILHYLLHIFFLQ